GGGDEAADAAEAVDRELDCHGVLLKVKERGKVGTRAPAVKPSSTSSLQGVSGLLPAGRRAASSHRSRPHPDPLPEGEGNRCDCQKPDAIGGAAAAAADF